MTQPATADQVEALLSFAAARATARWAVEVEARRRAGECGCVRVELVAHLGADGTLTLTVPGGEDRPPEHYRAGR